MVIYQQTIINPALMAITGDTSQVTYGLELIDGIYCLVKNPHPCRILFNLNREVKKKAGPRLRSFILELLNLDIDLEMSLINRLKLLL